MLKKLFNIEYNNKTFTIFIDENKRKTFLEINNKGEYIYPTLEDFLALHNMYNNINDKILYEIPRFTYQERVRTISGLLIVTCLFNGMVENIKNYKTEVTDTEVIISEANDLNSSKKSVIIVEDLDQLSDILGYKSITVEEVHTVIDNNIYLSEEYKQYAHNLVNSVVDNNPNFDLKIFYENIKTLKINEMTTEELQNKFNRKIAGNYDALNNEINISFDADISTIYHELGHISHSYYRDYEYVIIRRIEEAYALNEAMNNKLISELVKPESYYYAGLVLDYLLTCVNYDINDYNEKGIDYLISLLKKEYSYVDVDYIVECLNAIVTTEANLGTLSSLKEYPILLDELFLICESKVDITTDNPYQPFIDYVSIISKFLPIEEVLDYLDKYNKILICEGYTNIIKRENIKYKYDIYTQINWFVVIDNQGLAPMISLKSKFNEESIPEYYYETIDENGNKIDVYIENSDNIKDSYFIMPHYILVSLFEDYDIVGTNEFWQNLNNKYQLVSPHCYEQISVKYQNKVLKRDYLYNIKMGIGQTESGEIGFYLTNDDGFYFETKSDMQRLTDTISLTDYLFDTGWVTCINLEDVLNEEYLKEYIIRYGVNFKNLLLNSEGDLEVLPLYKINIKDEDNTVFNMELNKIYIGEYIESLEPHIVNNYLFINHLPKLRLDINLDNMFKNRIYLAEVLDYYNILDENVLEYNYTEEELKDLFINYVNDISKNRAR